MLKKLVPELAQNRMQSSVQVTGTSLECLSPLLDYV